MNAREASQAEIQDINASANTVGIDAINLSQSGTDVITAHASPDKIPSVNKLGRGISQVGSIGTDAAKIATDVGITSADEILRDDQLEKQGIKDGAPAMPIQSVTQLQTSHHEGLNKTSLNGINKSLHDSQSDIYQMDATNLQGMNASQNQMVTLNRDASTAGGGSNQRIETGQYGKSHPGFFNPNSMTKSGMIQMQANFVAQKDRKRQDPFVREGEDHFKKLFTFIQRKVEYENYRFKHPTLLAVVIESVNSQVTDNQRTFGKQFYRFHVSQDITIGDLNDIIKFKMNALIESAFDKITGKDKMVFFNENISLSAVTSLRDLYIQKREDDGWLYLDFIIEGYPV